MTFYLHCFELPIRSFRRPSFTLIELLISITIVAILAATILMTMQGAIEQGREARVRSQIKRINNVIMQRWESYRTRPMPIQISDSSMNSVRRTRLNALRELMRLELPERRTDIDPNLPGNPAALAVLPTLTSVARGYHRRINNAAWSDLHQSAECLYMILASTRVGDETALDDFKSSEIGDLDGDGMPEILDPWGNPIRFLRWAPGLIDSPVQSNDAMTQPDPYDPFKVGGDNFALFPFVYSAGPDGAYDIQEGTIVYSATPPPLPNNPYMSLAIGQVTGNGALDNFHNHLSE